MKRIIIATAFISASAVAAPPELANLSGETQNGQYRACTYSTASGFQFSINVRNRTCPQTVWVDPESGQVSRTPF